jgi:very-short-patch-repair endonuclease
MPADLDARAHATASVRGMHLVARVDDLPDVFLGRDAVAAGLLTPDELRGPAVRRVLRGVYSPAVVPTSHELRCAGAALVLGPGSMLTGRSAATVLGVPLASAADPVEVLAPEGHRTGLRAGLLVRRTTQLPVSTTTWRGFPVAPPERIAFDLSARHPLPTAVAHLDAFVRHGMVDLVSWRRQLERLRQHDVVAVRRAAELCDPRAESLPESRLRVVLALAGIETVPQHEVRADGRTYRLDLAVPSHRLGIEYDGTWHALREQLDRDRQRLNALAAAGWEVVHVTADLLATPSRAVSVVRAVLLRSGRTPNRRVLGL